MSHVSQLYTEFYNTQIDEMPLNVAYVIIHDTLPYHPGTDYLSFNAATSSRRQRRHRICHVPFPDNPRTIHCVALQDSRQKIPEWFALVITPLLFVFLPCMCHAVLHVSPVTTLCDNYYMISVAQNSQALTRM
jgi:hypothetical protein